VAAVALVTTRMTRYYDQPSFDAVFFVSHAILPPAVLPYLIADAAGHRSRRTFRGVARYIGIPAAVIALGSLALDLYAVESLPTIGCG
jgi:hypothetical protein